MQPQVLFENVTKRFGKKVAVNALNLALMPGELFAFLGPNGAGKTTTIKMLTGLLRPTEGVVTVVGQNMASNSLAARRVISYVPDQPYLYEKLSGRDFLEFTRNLYDLSGPDVNTRLEELIDLFELRGFVNELAETYSHGMRQRLVFAAALLHQPQVLVVDEPMVGLDPRSTRIVKELLRRESKRGTTVVMSTHTLNIAEEIADRIGIIRKGTLIVCGTRSEIRQQIGDSRSLEDYFLAVTGEENPEGPANVSSAERSMDSRSAERTSDAERSIDSRSAERTSDAKRSMDLERSMDSDPEPQVGAEVNPQKNKGEEQ